MEKYYARKLVEDKQVDEKNRSSDLGQSSTKHRVEINLYDFSSDPRLRVKIVNYDTNDRNKVGRAYLQIGPTIHQWLE